MLDRHPSALNLSHCQGARCNHRDCSLARAVIRIGAASQGEGLSNWLWDLLGGFSYYS
jgi:hypothetical protein